MKLTLHEKVLAGEGGTYRMYELRSDTPINGSRLIAEIRPIEDEGKVIGQRIVEQWNEREAYDAGRADGDRDEAIRILRMLVDEDVDMAQMTDDMLSNAVDVGPTPELRRHAEAFIRARALLAKHREEA